MNEEDSFTEAPVEDAEAVVENEEPESPPATPEEVAKAADLYANITGKNDFPQGAQFPHAGNIAKKMKDYGSGETQLGKTINEVLLQYNIWRE